MRDTGIYMLFLMLLLSFTSCSKQEDVCGKILGGYSEWNDYWYRYNYYFRLDTDSKVQVDELTYNSFYVGDYVCIEF